MNINERVILNKPQMLIFRYYSLIDAQTDIERLTTNVFFNSRQHAKIHDYRGLAKIEVDEDHHVLGRYNIIPYTSRAGNPIEKRETITTISAITRKRKVIDQGWEILSDLKFMEWYMTPTTTPGSAGLHTSVPQVKHSTLVRANMLRTKVYRSGAGRTWKEGPVLPDLSDLKNPGKNPMEPKRDSGVDTPSAAESSESEEQDEEPVREEPVNMSQARRVHRKRYKEEVKDLGDNSVPTTYSPIIRSVTDIMPEFKWNNTPPVSVQGVENESEESLEELVPRLVTQTIGNMEFLQILKCDTTFIASSITSSVLAIGTSLHTLFTVETTTTSKVLNSVAIVTSLTTFCLALNKLCDQYKIRNRIPELYPELPGLATEILNTNTKANSLVWIYPAISTLVGIVIAALTAFKVCDAKSIVEKGRLLTSTKAMSSTANDITKFLLEDIAGLDVTGDQKVFAELHTWAKTSSDLAVRSVMDFIQNAELNTQIHTAVSTTIPLITHKYSNKDLSHAARAAYQLILTNLSKLQEKVEAIKIIADACKRVETFGVLFGGKKGVGKSKLCAYVADYIAGIMGFPKTIYNLNKAKDTGFYGPYGGAAFAEIQEFMALKDQDPNLAHINQIISGDHFNLESAHLSGKQQPFNGRIVFLTANNLCPDLLRVLEKEAAKATWDRILRFEVIDEQVQGRTGQNAHRRPDFSHLEFNFITSTDEVNGANLQKRKVTIDEVLGIILYQTASREYQFLTSGLTSTVIDATEAETRIKFLKDIIDKNNKANSGQDFNILRLEGPPYSGKTRIAEQVSSYIHGILPTWPVVKVACTDGTMTPATPAKKGVYIIDDIIETNYTSYKTFLSWINSGHPDNFYIICTNHTYPKKWNRNLLYIATTPYWEFDTKACSSGIARRLGLEGEILCSDGTRVYGSPRTTQIYVPKPGTIQHQGEVLPLAALKELVFEKFQDFLKSKEIITVRYENYTSTQLDFDCTVRLQSYAHVAKAFASLITVTQARLGLIKGVELTFKATLIPHITAHFRNERELLPGIVKCRDTLVEQAEALSVILNRAVPGLSARFIITDTGDDIILKDRVLYVGFNMTQEMINIRHSATAKQISYHYAGITNVISYGEYARFLKSGVVPESMEDLPPEVIARINTYIIDNVKDSIFKYESFLADIEVAKQQFYEQNLASFAKNRPIITLIGGLVALTTASAIITLIAKAFKKEKPEFTSSNSAPDENHLDPRIMLFARKYKSAILKGESEVAQLRAEIAQENLTQKFNEWEHDWRSNSTKTIENYLPVALEKGDVKKIVELCQLNPTAVSQMLISNRANMLSTRDEKHQVSGPLEQLAERLRKNYVHVHSKFGNLYGLMVRGNIGITVAHCVSDSDSTLVITSDGKQYTAVIRKITRARDLLTFCIEDTKFPSAADITSLFPTYGDLLDLTSGWYIRPTTRPLLVNAPIEYVDRHAAPLRDTTNPFFQVQGRSWRYRLTGIASCSATFKIGDCGFPLVGMANNKFYIIGIHNAFALSSRMGWFASVSRDDVGEILSNRAEPRAALMIQHPLLKENMVLDDKMHSLVMTPYKVSVYEGMSPLKIHGYNENLHFRSYPKHKKILCEAATKVFECPTLGSALTTEHVTDYSKLYPDKNGNYYPMFSQVVKYALSQQREENFEKTIDAHVSQYLKVYYLKHYIVDKILKPHEIINGYGSLKPLDMSTSAGPKMKKFFGINTKRPQGNEDALFINTSKTHDPWYKINTDTAAGGALLSDYSHYMSMIKQGKPICMVVKDNGKVELLEKTKVQAGKVRVFNEIDLSINMVLKAYFGPILEKVMEKHDSTMYCIGMNPYKDATVHMNYFSMIDGEFINADFEALDKTVTAHLIEDFVECFLPHIPKESRDALFKTLTYRLHTMNGNVYFLDSGNASGSFVTTLLNCHVVAKTTFYTFCRNYKQTFGRLPSHDEIDKNIMLRGLGDDAIRKVNQIFVKQLTQEEFMEDAMLYRLKQTPAKTQGEVSFCSREYTKFKDVYFPKLKQTSIISSLFWLKSNEPEQVHQNCFTAIMEAGLWDKEFFELVTRACVELSKLFRFHLDIADFALVQECWYEYIKGKRNTPVWGGSNPNCIIDDTHSNATIFKKMADMWLNEYVQKNKLDQPIYKYSAEGPDESLRWSCNVTILEEEVLMEGNGTGGDKAEAKRNACEELRQAKSGATSNVEIEWLCYKHLGKEYHVKKCENHRKDGGGIFKAEVAFIRYLKNEYPAIDFMKKDARKALMKLRCTTAIKTAVEGYINTHLLPEMKERVEAFTDTLCDKENITGEEMKRLDAILGAIEALNVKANVGDMPIEPAVMNQAMNAQAAAELPSQLNPQPTGVAPAVTAPGDDIMSAIQIAQETTLNPIGAPNMLSVGAIGFDLKALIYEQFLDCDTEFSTTESAPTGSVILQIPYAVISQFTNYYIKAYASLHERYTGSIRFRVTAIGNQLLSGAVGVCWRESRTTEATILISEAQKIAYEMKGVNNPFNEIHTLHDARRSDFYRTVSSDTTENLDNRPHLVIFVGMNVYNPYRDDSLVRFRIASKLSNGREPNPFLFALPKRADVINNAAVINNTAPLTVSPAQSFNDMFVQTLNTPIHMYTDGILRKGSDYAPDTKYESYNARALNNAAYKFAYNGTVNKATMSTCSSSVYTNSQLQTSWPLMREFFTERGVVPHTTTVSIVSQSTMDSKSFCILTGSCSYPGFGRISTNTLPGRTEWTFMKNAAAWPIKSVATTYVPPNDIEIHSITYNDAEIVLGENEGFAGRRFYHARFGQIKIVTNKGTAIYYLTATTTDSAPGAETLQRQTGLLSEWVTDPLYPSQSVFDNLPIFPNFNVDAGLGAMPGFTALPLGYQALRFSDIPASAVTIEDYPGPTATDESCLERWFYQRAADIPITRCLEMILVDSTSQRIITTVRYYQEWRMFVINAETPNYRTLPFTTANIIVQSISEVERTNAFAMTDTSLWFARQSSLAYAAQEALIPLCEYQQVKSNAMAIAGGIIGGLGQGMNAIADRRHQEKMQGNTFAHELTMQGNMFQQQSLYQGNQHEHEQRMATMNQEFQQMLQQNNFQQEQTMVSLQAREDRSTQRLQSANRMNERGLGTRSNFLNTSFGTQA